MKRYVLLASALLLIVAMLVGCGDNNGVADTDGGAAVGDRVTVNYAGSLDDGTVFASSEGEGPLTFVIGDGTMLAGFDETVRGMKVGDIKSVVIPAAEAYGEYREDLVVVLSREELPEDLEVGGQVSLQNITSGETRSFTVVDITDDEVTLDGNHPLAGQGLTFMIELVALEPAGTFEDGSEE
jgi:FKBP-type peptidyl-prolyl cis-trans isomerase 2